MMADDLKAKIKEQSKIYYENNTEIIKQKIKNTETHIKKRLQSARKIINNNTMNTSMKKYRVMFVAS